MDNDKKLFEALLKADGIDPAGATESERIAFAKILDGQSKPKPSKPGIVRPDIWRIIMQSKITKLTAAAAIILVGITIINQFGGSIDVATVAWADVVEEINNYTRYKCRQRVVRQDGTYFPTMDVYHLNLSQRRQEVEDGSIHIIDMRGTDVITVELYPAEKKAIVTKLIGAGPRKDPHIIEMVKQFEQESTERLGTKEVDGKILLGFRHVPNAHSDFTVWVDPETKLPVEIELVHTQRGQTIFLDEFEFDFELDPSAFSTEIPEGYEVETLINDYRLVEAKDVTAEDMQKELKHVAYLAKRLPWIEQIAMIRNTDPLGSKTIVYMTGIQTNDDNVIIVAQGDYYDIDRMVWIPDQQLVLETPSGIELYAHPNGAIYAKRFLKSFAKAKPEFFDIKDISKERFTWMIVMPDRTILSLSANKQMSDEMAQELVESLTEILQASHNADSNKEQDYAVQGREMPGGVEATIIKAKGIAKDVDFEFYVLSAAPVWGNEPKTLKVSNVMGLGDDIYMTCSLAEDGRHVVFMQAEMMSKMLLNKIRTGEHVYTSDSGLKVYRGGPEKWYSGILLESVGSMLPDKSSADRIGCGIETPDEGVILLAINGPATDEELFGIIESLKLVQ